MIKSKRCVSLASSISTTLIMSIVTTYSFAATCDVLNQEAEKLKCKHVLDTHDKVANEPTRKYKDLKLLGFVTPWNAKGKHISIVEARRGRLDITSPVTWQVHPNGLAGGEDFEKSYYADLLKAGTRIYPRMLFEGWAAHDFMQLALDPQPMINRIDILCDTHKFEGVVLEIWPALISSQALQNSADSMFGLVKAIGEGLRRKNVRTVLVLPPYDRDVRIHNIHKESLQELQLGFSHFIVMTYDYTLPGSSPGPIAPLEWVRRVGIYLAQDCQLRDKLLLGLNFYGIDFLQRKGRDSGADRHIVGHEVVSLLEEHRPDMIWVKEAAEHSFFYGGGEHVVFFPSRESIRARIQVAQELGCGGVAVWDIGQGLDYFFEEF